LGRVNRDNLGRKCAAFVAALALVVFVSVVAVGGPSGILSAIAIGIAVAVALFSDTQGACSRPFRRRG
jgi:hypothetical protein